MTPRRNYGWMIYFGVLIVLGVTAMVLPILYNLGQQLRPEQFDEARLRWREQGPADYDLTFSIRYDRDPTRERHIVRVRGGRPVFAMCEGAILYADPALAGAIGLPFVAVEDAPAWTMERIFDRIGGFLAEQQESQGRNFLVVAFDPHQGYPRRFVRRISRTSTREEWELKLWQPGELERQAAR